jgi:4-hydroxythreonine-4-phosphate dehydrogenase
MFGDEEIREIAPAVADAQAEGIDAVGPLPPDTVFARHCAGDFDAVVAMVHDHGHIAVKTVGFMPDVPGGTRIAGVNVTLGLPIIRTSVDHGTAFEIAGKGLADPTSMVDAITLAAEMAGTA